MKKIAFFILFVLVCSFCSFSQVSLPGFVNSFYFGEQVMSFDYDPGVKVEINAPSVENFNPKKPTAIVIYALPNGNSIDWTIGKRVVGDDDWHYNIQHIGAQTRFVRARSSEYNWVTVYLEANSKSWGNWRKVTKNGDQKLKQLIESILKMFESYSPYIVMSGHSGGGNVPFAIIDASENIPEYINRIVFLDSNYNWDNMRYGEKLKEWLERSSDNRLVVICYDDINALYNGKPFVSSTGGTWYRTQVMQKYLAENLEWKWIKNETDVMTVFRTCNRQVEFRLVKNPARKIYHTVLVERNGYIHSLLFGERHENEGYEFWGDVVYNEYIQPSTVVPHVLRIPPRRLDALKGSEFMKRVIDMTLEERDSAILHEVTTGNIPNAFRKTVMITDTLSDAEGIVHTITFWTLPDVIAVGSDEDFVRVPMGPSTAQYIADRFGATLPTTKLSDLIAQHSIVKLNPSPMKPDSMMTTVPVFLEHNRRIEVSRDSIGMPLSSLISGHKKDVVISNRIVEKPDKVMIYGWHRKDGTVIQPLCDVHTVKWVDYSHGIRLINSEILVDGKLTTVDCILRDPVLYKLLSDEAVPMTQTKYF